MYTPFVALEAKMFSVLTGLGYSVYDFRPENKSFPYIVIGEDSLSTSHTKTNDHFTVLSTIHVFSKKTGGIEIKNIMDNVVGNIRGGMSMSDGYYVTHSEVELFDYYEDTLPEILHGVIQIRLQIVKTITGD